MMKVKAIQRRRWPLTHKGLRSLLGLANYYHHFIQDFSKVATILPDLLEENSDRTFSMMLYRGYSNMKCASFSTYL